MMLPPPPSRRLVVLVARCGGWWSPPRSAEEAGREQAAGGWGAQEGEEAAPTAVKPAMPMPMTAPISALAGDRGVSGGRFLGRTGDGGRGAAPGADRMSAVFTSSTSSPSARAEEMAASGSSATVAGGEQKALRLRVQPNWAGAGG